MRIFLISTFLLLLTAFSAAAATIQISGTGEVETAQHGVGVNAKDKLSFTAQVTGPEIMSSSYAHFAQKVYQVEAFQAQIGDDFVDQRQPDALIYLVVANYKDGLNSVKIYLNPGNFVSSAAFSSFTLEWKFDSDDLDASLETVAALDFSSAVETTFFAVDSRAPNDIAVTGQLMVTNVAPVPLPAALWLGLAGLGALGLTRRRA
ncbi:hypothetical protein [Dinoroseobacter sp. S76]|uniref:hypothetical protein n=1 Tax=Dinoroseobacter sp. S76 TaxID=3415124 RepID=UPI003C7B7B9B